MKSCQPSTWRNFVVAIDHQQECQKAYAKLQDQLRDILENHPDIPHTLQVQLVGMLNEKPVDIAVVNERIVSDCREKPWIDGLSTLILRFRNSEVFTDVQRRAHV